MDASRFDSWTRRRFGLATGGALVAALSLSVFDEAKAKKKRRKKRCLRVNQPCREGSKKKRCCKDLRCDEAKVISPTGLGCCRHFQARCESEIECCTSFKCLPAVGLAGKRCCGSLGVFCREDSDCCAGDGVICHPLHNCCRRVQAACAANDECCGELVCDQIAGLGTDTRCCSASDGFCTEDEHCCEGFACNTADQQCVPV